MANDYRQHLPLDVREISVGSNDLYAFGTFDDHPNQIAFVAETVADGVRQRRLIFFPRDPFEAASLAQALMEIAGIQQISISKKKAGAHVTFGPTSAQKALDKVNERSGRKRKSSSM